MLKLIGISLPVIVILMILLASGYVKAPPNKAAII